MAGNLKQRLIKAGRDFNYAEGIKVKNSDAANSIAANTVVCVQGHEGIFLKVKVARGGTALETTGRLHITKHEIPAGGYGVVLPWKLVTGLSNAADAGAPTNIGTEVYLHGDGKWSTTSSSGRKIGVVVTVGTGATSTDGAVLLCGEGHK